MALIHEFIISLSCLTGFDGKKAIVIVCQEESFHFRALRVAFLVGAYELLVQNMPIKEVEAWLEYVQEADNDVSFQMQNDIKCLLRALNHAFKKGYIEYEKNEGNNLICDNIDEYLHYATTVNGNVNIVVPGKLVIFPNPSSLSNGLTWEDTGSGTVVERAFGARYYADLLRHLDVHVVANLATAAVCPSGLAAAATFEEAGLACEDGLLPSGSIGEGLRAHDRLLTLGRTAGGAVALQCGDAVATAALRTLVAGVLIEQEGFGAAEAEAWLRLMCPSKIKLLVCQLWEKIEPVTLPHQKSLPPPLLSLHPPKNTSWLGAMS
jgi:hypothetical protein